MMIPAASDLVALFSERLGSVGGHTHQVASSAEASALVAPLLPSGTTWISRDLADRAPGFVASLAEAGHDLRVPTKPTDARDQPFGIAIAEGAIAETGSAIMSEPRVESRAVTLVTETLVIVCPSASLVPSLDEAAGILRDVSANGASYATFLTGPSRTADIERQLTVGVQGPGVLHVVLVDDLS